MTCKLHCKEIKFPFSHVSLCFGFSWEEFSSYPLMQRSMDLEYLERLRSTAPDSALCT